MQKNYEQLKQIRIEYASMWNSKSEIIYKTGFYEWMADFLDGYERVLEIGSGTGYAAKALIENGHSIVSIDENPECLRLARKNLHKDSIASVLIERGESIFDKGRYNIEYDEIDANIHRDKVVLIEGDILKDPHLAHWLRSGEQFDAIICWLIGTHFFRDNSKILEDHEFSVRERPLTYRRLVQDKVYKLAGALLRDNGILQIVDKVSSDKDSDIIFENHQSRADDAFLKIEEIHYKYAADMVNELHSIAAAGDLDAKQESGQAFLASIISKKK